MKISSYFTYTTLKQTAAQKRKTITNTISNAMKELPAKARTSAVISLFLLPTLGTVTLNSCKTDKNPDKIEIIDKPIKKTNQNNHLEIREATIYTVEKGDTPSKIADKFDVSVTRLLFENNLDNSSIIYPEDTLLIPASYKVKNIKTLDDVAELTGLSKNFLNDLCDMESVKDSLYTDRTGNKTIGVGHLVKNSELAEFKDKKLSDSQIYSILAQDLIDKNLNIKTFITEDAYNSIPLHLKESIIDLAFNKGDGAIRDNKEIIDGLNNKDYVKVIANLTQDYSVVTKANGEKVKKYASGLSKRRLYDIKNASEIFKNGIPTEVLKSAQTVYENGLKHMAAEHARGEFSDKVYNNVLSEYKGLAYTWFNGKFGEERKEYKKPAAQESENKIEQNTSKQIINSNTTATANTSKIPNGNQTVLINGKKTNWTVETLSKEWDRTAKEKLRPFKRPQPVVDKNGNLVAEVKHIPPQKGIKGRLSGYTIIVNPGHGGAVASNSNVNFDPGTSNAVMSKKNKNIETNDFIGNGGKPLEEWIVNKRIADVLVDKITNAGGKVIYVQGSVHTAMKAIRKIQKENKIDLIVSLHSNSDGDKRGIYVIGNKRGGIDKEDQKFAQVVYDKMNTHSWFKGITHKTEQSLAVLSSSASKSSPIPGILVETGNLKNKTDVANLNSRDFKNQMINSIFEGIQDYLKNK